MSVSQMPHLIPAPVTKLIVSSGSWSSEHIIPPLNIASTTPGHIFLPRIDTFYQVMKKTSSLVTTLQGKYFEIVRTGTGPLAPTTTLGWLELDGVGPIWRRGQLDAREPDPPRVPGPYGLKEIRVVIRPIPGIPDCTRTTPPILEDLFVVSQAIPPQSLYGMVYNGTPADTDIHSSPLTPSASTYLPRSPGPSMGPSVGGGRPRRSDTLRERQVEQAVAGPSRPTLSTSRRRQTSTPYGRASERRPKGIKSTARRQLPVTPPNAPATDNNHPYYWYPQVQPSNHPFQQSSDAFTGEPFLNFGAVTTPGTFGLQPTADSSPQRGYDAASSSMWQNPSPLGLPLRVEAHQESQLWAPSSIPGGDTLQNILRSFPSAPGSSGHAPAPLPADDHFSTYFDVDPQGGL
ncbi:uncharacterized protein EI90DRAFT_3018326 [Cantharellus anzutake]|uniref:uncharacterized protein n=1 Tax=Cantharellus anzutake TaxID=1750568 RepID=UPI001906DD08|nr:uncharacterized protein EI90DRAFT_3018326 [Cantharellus anzutake]KAF8327277.1 hypothetical protein EI90DRAFT_3018326 [Cantharellus anzutake]